MCQAVIKIEHSQENFQNLEIQNGRHFFSSDPIFPKIKNNTQYIPAQPDLKFQDNLSSSSPR